MNYETDFKKKLVEKWKDNNISESSIKLYVRNLEKLNNDKPLTSLNFLKKYDDIINKLSNYKETTKRNYIISICSALSIMGIKNKLYIKYYNELKKKNSEIHNEESKNQKTEQQNKNWISWNEIKEKQQELINTVSTFKNKKEINSQQYDVLLNLMILSLYVEIPPRRNKDYLNMLITNTKPENDKYNWLEYKKKKFIFNDFKTSKTEGQNIIDIPDKLMNIINIYLKFHPLIDNKKTFNNQPLLVDYKGTSLSQVNSITQRLNRILDKKVSSSMIRHIYLTEKYSDIKKEMNKDSKAMSHSVDTQQNIYVKTD